MNPRQKAYRAQDPESLIVRDHLALDRTILANERTLLSYVRTTFVLLASGMTLLKLFPDDPTLRIIGLILMGMSFCACSFGILRFVGMRKHLDYLTQR